MEGRREGNPGDHPVSVQRLTPDLESAIAEHGRAARPDYFAGAMLALIHLAAIVPRIAAHVLWRDELQAWMIANDGSPGLFEVVRRAAYETHPVAWPVLLWLTGHVWHDPSAMKILHAAFAVGSIYLIGAFLPAPQFVRALLSVNYFIVFEYAVVSRNYAIGLMPLLAFAALRTWRPRALLSQAVCLALAAQANIYAAMLAGLLGCWAGARWLIERPDRPARFAAAVAILTSSLIATAVELVGPADRSFLSTGSQPWASRFYTVLGGVWQAFVPLPMTKRDWWNSNLLDNTFSFATADRDLAIVGAVVCLIVTWLLPPRRGVRTLWLAGAAAMFVFGAVFYAGYVRHHGQFFVLFLLASWLGRDAESSSSPNGRARDVGLIALVFVGALAGVGAAIADLCLPFSASGRVARFLNERFPDADIIADQDATCSAVAGHLGRALYYPRAGRSGTFMIWGNAPRNEEIGAADFAALAEQRQRQSPQRPIILLVDEDYAPWPDAAHFRLLGKFGDSTVFSERYLLYRYEPASQSSKRAAQTRP